MSSTNPYKQVICVRKDLNMRKGKIAAQASHACLTVYIDYNNSSKFVDQFKGWLEQGQTKICVSVDSEQELIDIYNKGRAAGIPCSIITDAGRTEFHGIPTKTVVALGPAEVSKMDNITGNLKLL